MSKLVQLRRQLAALRRARQTARWGTGLCALGIALLVTLGALFALDLVFELNVPQRLLMFAVGLAAVVWAARKYALPHFHAGESIEDMALQVERQHRIPSDLIAALQFESPAAASWGSTALEQQVISRVEQTSPRLDVFAGFSRESLLRRAGIFLVLAAVAVIGGLLFPEYLRVFGERLLLASTHYPTATVIEQIHVGQALAYERSRGNLQPTDVKLPQGHAVPFVIAARGTTPPSGHLTLRDSSGREREVAIERLSPQARKRRLEMALQLIEPAESTSIDRTKAAALVQAEAPELAEKMRKSDNREVTQLLTAQLAAWSDDEVEGTLYAGELPRLISSVDYQVYLGDAWTDTAAIHMIGLPVVEIEYRITPPPYATTVQEQQRVETGARRISVLEGSQIELFARCVNDKQLEEVTLAIHDTTSGEEAKAQREHFKKQDSSGTSWTYAPPTGPLHSVDRQLQLSIACRDSDGLTLEAPITCWVHLEADRSPTATASVVHKVVLPGASPVVEYRVNDDYAIASIKLLVDVERANKRGEPTSENLPETSSISSPEDAETIGRSRAGERHVVAIAPVVKSTMISGPWPHTGEHSLDLSAYSLVKGDHVKLTLEVTDYRGENEGETTLSDPLIVEVSDESGVLAAISEADQRSEERLNELIKRQLGIGESP